MGMTERDEGRVVTPTLSQAEIDALPEGACVRVTWSGGNGPHEYEISRSGGVCAMRDGVFVGFLHMCGEYPLTQVWRAVACPFGREPCNACTCWQERRTMTEDELKTIEAAAQAQRQNEVEMADPRPPEPSFAADVLALVAEVRRLRELQLQDALVQRGFSLESLLYYGVPRKLAEQVSEIIDRGR